MCLSEIGAGADLSEAGRRMHALAAELFPIRQTQARLAAEMPLEIVEVPSGTQAFDCLS